MLDDLRWLGFRNITEVRTALPSSSAEDFSLFSYQFNFLSVDSAMLLTGGGRTILNSNDCKTVRMAPAARSPEHSRRSTSCCAATRAPERYRIALRVTEKCFPTCALSKITLKSSADLRCTSGPVTPYRSRAIIVSCTGKRWLSTDTAVVPDDVQTYYKTLAARSHIDSECVVMAPGSNWSEHDGFRLVPFDYSRRQERIDEMLATHRGALVSQYAKEDETIADFAAFRAYFLPLIHSVRGSSENG